MSGTVYPIPIPEGPLSLGYSLVDPKFDRIEPFADHMRNHPAAPFLVVSPTEVAVADGEEVCPGIKIYCLLCNEDLWLCGVPEERHRWTSCLGSSGGWLMVFDDVSNLHMLNPITGKVISLPPLSSFEDDIKPVYAAAEDGSNGSMIVSYRCLFRFKPMMSTAKEAGRSYFSKAIFGYSSAANAPVVMAITRGESRNLAFTRVGDNDMMAWTSVGPSIAHPGDYDDIMHLKGRFYALDGEGELTVFDFDGVRAKSTVISDDLFILGGDEGDCDRYLAHSGDGNTIYQVLKITNPGQLVRVYELQDNNRWVQADGVAGYTLFLGDNQVISVKNRDFPTVRECSFYFTRDYSEPLYFCREPADVHHKPISKVEFQNFSTSYPEKYRRAWPYPVWYMPDCFPPRGGRVETRGQVETRSMRKKREEKGIEEAGTTTKKRGKKRVQ